jgi:hypothetical protein
MTDPGSEPPDTTPWGGTSLTEPTVLRRNYISALQTADREGDFGPLVEFARS